MSVLTSKEYPEDYPSDATTILNAMSFGDGLMLVGSMSLRSQQYAGDFDGYEIVNTKGSVKTAVHKLKLRFQEMIKELQKIPNVYIGDIKAGVVEEWRVLPLSIKLVRKKVQGYDAKKARAVLESIPYLTAEERSEGLKALPTKMTSEDYFKAKEIFKYHVIRWKPSEVLHGSKQLQDGRTMTLEEAFQTRGIAKMDAIGLVQNSRFTDFSVIYQFRNKGKILNDEPMEIEQSLKENVVGLQEKGQFFKSIKRLFALAKLLNDEAAAKDFSVFLNSDVGRLYQIQSDVGTLIDLLEDYNKVPLDTVRFEIDQMVGRLSNVVELHDPKQLDLVRHILSLSRDKMVPSLQKLYDSINSTLQTEAKKFLGIRK